MGLTTQIPKDIKVASKAKEVRTKIGSMNVRRVKGYVDVTNENYHFLEILDALKDFKQIPALNKKSAIDLLINTIISLKKSELPILVKYGNEYPPRVTRCSSFC